MSITATSSLGFNWLPQQSAWSQTQSFDSTLGISTPGSSDQTSAYSDAFANAATSLSDGLVNMTADVAAKRLGVNLNSGSGSSSSSSTPSTPSTDASTSSGGSTSTSDPTATDPSTSDPNSTINDYQALLTNFDKLGMPGLATDNGSSADGTVAGNEQNLANLDAIAMGLPAPTSTVDDGSSSDAFDYGAYLRNLDAITTAPPKLTDVTA